ncbi:MAG: leucine-rich repeat domain-containing protein, partial [Ruminococcus sp.]
TCYAEETNNTEETFIFDYMELTLDHKTDTLYIGVTDGGKSIMGRHFYYDEYDYLVYDKETKDWIYDFDKKYDQYEKLDEILSQAKKIVIDEGITCISKDFFHDLPNLKEVVLPGSLKEIGEFAFWNCPKLISVYGKNVTKIETGAFARCTSLEYANFPQLTTLYAKKLSLTDEEVWGVEVCWKYPIHEYYVGAFQECTALKNIYIPKLERLGAKTFYKCSNLTKINNNNKLDKITYIGRTAFYGCKSLKTISLGMVGSLSSGRDPFSDSEMLEGMFGNCTSLNSVDIPCVVYIGDGCFYGCKSLKTINRNNKLFTFQSPYRSKTYLGAYAFAGCKSLKTITLIDVNEIKTGKWNYYKEGTFKYDREAAVGENIINTKWNPDGYNYQGVKYCGVFENCTNLKNVNLVDTTVVGKRAFLNCSSLQSANITSAKNIGAKAFCNCTKLSTVKTGNNGKSIGNYAFYKCSSLKTFTIPKQVTQIGVRAFAKCSKLKTINFRTTTFNTIGLDAFKLINKTPTFNLPKSKLKTCKKLIKPNAPSKAKFVGKY